MLKLPLHDGIDINLFSQIVNLNNLTNSYKVYWLYSLFEEIIRGNKIISFETLVCRMIAKNWYSTIQYRLNLGAQDHLYHLVLYIYNKYIPDKKISEDYLIKEIKHLIVSVKDNELREKFTNLYNYVPYRFLSIFFTKELKGLKDYCKNRVIEELSNKTENTLYKINTNNKIVIVNDVWADYINKNQAIVKGWILYNLIVFLQKRNPNVPAIPYKIFPPTERNLHKQAKFWKLILNYRSFNDIYTDIPLTEENFLKYGGLSIDHFIPWSFVLHDELWNLIPTFKSINSSKSDNLPSLEKYFNKFLIIQYEALKTAIEYGIHDKILEDYLTVNSSISIRSKHQQLEKSTFLKNLKSTVEPLYQIAKNQGFREWCWQP